MTRREPRTKDPDNGSLEWEIANITGTSVDADGFMSVTIDSEGEHGSIPIPVQHMNGLWGMPLDPVVDKGTGEPIPSKACQVLVAWEGGKAHAFPLNDPRTVGKLPLGVPGERVLWADAGHFYRQHADGSHSWVTSTTGGGTDGQTVQFRVRPTTMLFDAPWGRLTFDGTGFRVRHVGGAALSLGYAGGPIPGLGSYATLSGDMVKIAGSAIAIGPTGSAQQGVAQALPLQVVLQSMMVALESLAAGVSGIPSGGAAAAATAATQIALAQTAVAQLLATCATRTAIG
jgi:hypothetical protein